MKLLINNYDYNINKKGILIMKPVGCYYLSVIYILYFTCPLTPLKQPSTFEPFNLIYHLKQGVSVLNTVQGHGRMVDYNLSSISWYKAFQMFLVKYCVVMINQRKWQNIRQNYT